MNKKTTVIVLSSSLILALVFISACFVVGIFKNQNGLQKDSGVIVSKTMGDYTYWGLQVKKGIIFRRVQVLAFIVFQQEFAGYGKNIVLPDEFKKDGLRVKCAYFIVDRFGMGADWGEQIALISISEDK